MSKVCGGEAQKKKSFQQHEEEGSTSHQFSSEAFQRIIRTKKGVKAINFVILTDKTISKSMTTALKGLGISNLEDLTKDHIDAICQERKVLYRIWDKLEKFWGIDALYTRKKLSLKEGFGFVLPTAGGVGGGLAIRFGVQSSPSPDAFTPDIFTEAVQRMADNPFVQAGFIDHGKFLSGFFGDIGGLPQNQVTELSASLGIGSSVGPLGVDIDIPIGKVNLEKLEEVLTDAWDVIAPLIRIALGLG
ncbi:MAG: hypothetical protein IMF19_13490 [Proteobacteria bacterium]|jgi:hypothetical protein|nr:hypothetical protein [Pseudomonadota bacterium]